MFLSNIASKLKTKGSRSIFCTLNRQEDFPWLMLLLLLNYSPFFYILLTRTNLNTKKNTKAALFFVIFPPFCFFGAKVQSQGSGQWTTFFLNLAIKDTSKWAVSCITIFR